MFKVHEYDIVDWCVRVCDYLWISGLALVETSTLFPV
jgi:hypothetical protein